MRTGRKFGAVPVAFSSAERESRCWDGQWLDKSRDIAAVRVCGLPCSCIPASVHPATAPLAAMRTPALARAAIWEEALAACCPRVLWGCVLSDLGWTHMYFPLQVCQVSLQVKAAWNVLAAREGWDKLPVYALGASSGAAMVRA